MAFNLTIEIVKLEERSRPAMCYWDNGPSGHRHPQRRLARVPQVLGSFAYGDVPISHDDSNAKPFLGVACREG